MADPEATPQTLEAQRTLVVTNKLGIHARPAAMIVRVANKYKADVIVEKEDEQVSAKSIMGLMMLAAGHGTELRFSATGEQAEALLEEMQALFDRKFEET